MTLEKRKPRPPLDRFVDVFWYFRGAANGACRQGKERALPDGCLQLVINLREDRHRIYDRQDFQVRAEVNGCLIVGPQSEYSVIDTTADMHLTGVHFKPGGAYPFLAPPAAELHGKQVPLDSVWGSSTSELRERLLEAPDVQQRFDVLEDALLTRATRALECHAAVRFAIERIEAGPSASTIAAVVEQTGLSPRHFIEIFRQQVGLTPKLFCRVRRFQQALACIASSRPVRWTDVALDAGYFDQAHFIHDFRAFSGISPSMYRESRPWHANHVPIAP